MTRDQAPVTIPDFWVRHIRALLQKQADKYTNERDIPGPLWNSIKVIDERRRAAGLEK